MPNWCSNETICFLTDKSDVEKLIKKITKGIKENPIPNGFGPNWLGNLAYIIGVDYNESYCRGELLEDSYEIEKKGPFYYVHLSTETAWSSDDNYWKEILYAFNEKENANLKSVSLSVEPGCEVFVNTDYEHLFFDDQYYLEIYSDEDNIEINENFASIEELISYLNDFMHDKNVQFKVDDNLSFIEERICESLNNDVYFVLAIFE